MLTCSKCGYDNELGRIFCHSCGAKLDLSEIKSPSQGGAKLKKSGGGTGRLVWRLLGGLILLAVIAIVCLAAQVPHIRPISTTNQDLISADKKRFDLDQLAALNRPQVISITEAELNAFISSLGFAKGENKGAALTPVTVQLELGNGVVTAIFVGKLSVGSAFSKRVYLSYVGKPTIEDGQFVFQPVSGAIGSLPIPQPLMEATGIFDQCFGKLFANLSREQQVLNSLKSISVTPQQVELSYEPPAATH
ncbi:MAG TPA: zinc ribbon domain-containing protein [Verrucomicrobiae bacterium]|nr:zinc ribbon domain-containing protein [Verrucomicrobiae bacterium]